MEYIVEGTTISAAEWLDGYWQPSPAFRAQEKRRLQLRQATPHLNSAQQATHPRNDLKTRPPPLRIHGPLPRMSPDAIHIVGRPKPPVDLTKPPHWLLYEALLNAVSLPDLPPASRDKVRVHPTNNTFNLSVRESVRAQAYLRITSLQIGVLTVEFQVYAPPPDDEFSGIVFNAYGSFTDAEILKDLQESNPTMPVIGTDQPRTLHHALRLFTTMNLLSRRLDSPLLLLPKSRSMLYLPQECVSDLQQPPTRIGNSVCRDTSPDLTLCKNVTRATWENTGLLVGSNHNILAITIQTSLNKKPKPTAHITDCPKYRQLREEQASNTITDINEWIASLQEHVQVTICEVKLPPTCPQPTLTSSTCGTHTLSSCAGGAGRMTTRTYTATSKR
ncbi:hypothetical protein HPB51_004270 [Rhipicephalus microplus]|uniref:Tick transposon n=1 Tax=Rhipicephalus microplus TaxID=6941 RepID=A0A9J6EX19_RHIMP|nr:hypothetical protein HPB51_004270 [Rhipicephalus microplus]